MVHVLTAKFVEDEEQPFLLRYFSHVAYSRFYMRSLAVGCQNKVKSKLQA